MIYAVVQAATDTTPADDVIIENAEELSESEVVVQEESEIHTQQNNDVEDEDLKQYENKLNSYEMVIWIYENEVDMKKYELGTEKVAKGEDAIAPEPPSIEHYEFVGWSELPIVCFF